MDSNNLLLALSSIMLMCVVLNICAVQIIVQDKRKIKQLEQQLKSGFDKSLKTQRAVIKGQLAEQMFPLIISLSERYTLSDFKYFGGNPFDYILFDGLTEAKDNNGEFKELVLIDIKTGNAVLSEHQKKIKAKINAGHVKCRTFRLLDDGTFKEE